MKGCILYKKNHCLTQKKLYMTGIAIGGLVILLLVLKTVLSLSFFNPFPVCVIKEFTGFYCPGCGGTRAILALLKGDLISSLLLHPIVIYGVILYLVYMGANTISMLSKGKISLGFRLDKKFIFIGILIIALHFLLRNLYLLVKLF